MTYPINNSYPVKDTNMGRAETVAIKRMMEDDAWDVLMQILARRLERLRGEPITGQNAFEELRMLHVRQGKIDGLVEFFDDIEKLSFD